MFDAIVVGSGPAGTFSAYGLRPKNTLLLDVGYTAKDLSLPEENIYDMRRKGQDLFEALIGKNYESLHNLHQTYMSPKLKGPLMRFVTRSPASVKMPGGTTFAPVSSYAQGGLANAWGAGVLRFTDQDLIGFPIQSKHLEPYYDELTTHMGINGTEDELTPYFGSTKDLMPPLELSPFAEEFFRKYNKNRKTFHLNSLYLGRTRAAILTRDLGNRKKHTILGQEFFQPNLSSVYHPGYTLQEMISRKEIVYKSGYLVTHFEEFSDHVCVYAHNLQSNVLEAFKTKHLLLAAGTLNTTKIVLTSFKDERTRLPLLDNPVSFIPFISPFRIGRKLDVHAFSGGELILLYQGNLYPQPVQASFYGLVAPLRSDLFFQFPLSIFGNFQAIKYLLPALGMLQVFYPDTPSSSNYIQLGSTGDLKLQYQKKALGKLETHILSTLRSIGYFGLSRLCQFPQAGSSIHYAGTLPMRTIPNQKYETDSEGRLFGTKRIFITDASTYPSLPSKNLTFTIMANALRIARNLDSRY